MPKDIGIDLGTTNSVVAYEHDRTGVEVVLNRVNERGTKSVVGLHARSGETLIGTPAVENAARNPENTIVQGIRIGMPGLDVFFAEASLRAGEHYPERLRAEILARDVFYLFWSQAASRSDWVGIEWRFAYENRGIDAIKPIPLVPPHIAAPPPELGGELHFNDWVLAHKRRVHSAH